MAYQKMKPCPACQSGEYLAVYTYDSGWRHVECDTRREIEYARSRGKQVEWLFALASSTGGGK